MKTILPAEAPATNLKPDTNKDQPPGYNLEDFVSAECVDTQTDPAKSFSFPVSEDLGN